MGRQLWALVEESRVRAMGWFEGELPLRFAEQVPDGLDGYPELEVLRSECLRETDAFGRSDALLAYAGVVLGVGLGESGPELACEATVAVVNAAYWQREVAVELLGIAYECGGHAAAAWGKSGSYLRKSAGLVEFAELQCARWVPADECRALFKVTNALKLEVGFLQQMGVVVLSLSKLRSEVYRDRRDAVLDFEDEDVATLSQNSGLYARLIIGCLEMAAKLPGSSVVNRPVQSYLNSLVFLMMSLDQYAKDQSGVAVGMIEQSIRYLSQIVPAGRLADSILGKRKKTDFFRNAVHRKSSDSKSGKTLKWITRSKREELLPVLKTTLDDFVIPLAQLLRYRYKQTNEKLAYQTVENDEATLRKLFPRGKTPELKGSEWFFNRETAKLQEVVETASAAGYY